MNRWIHKCAVLLVTAGALTLTLEAAAEEKVQKITFIEDDAQKNMASKIYVLKYSKAADIAPFVRGAVVRYCKESNVSTVSDAERNREMLIVSTGIKNIKYVDDIVAALDRNAKMDKFYRSKVRRFKGENRAFLASVYAWMKVKQGKEQEALKALLDSKKTTDHPAMMENIERLSNGKIKHYSNSGFGDMWYALGLEEPKIKPQRQMRGF